MLLSVIQKKLFWSSCLLLEVMDKAVKGSPGAAVKLLPCNHEVMGSSPENRLLQKCRERLCTLRPKVVRPFPGPCASGSYVHWAAFFSCLLLCVIGLVSMS
jgi:hypothetical protein